MSTWTLLAFLLHLVGGCANDGVPQAGGRALPPGCSDVDRDRYGVGRDCRGPDCDEWNPLVHVCGLDCEAHPEGTGCPCAESSTPVACYDGPVEALGNGPCQGGVRACTNGLWSPC